MKKLFTLICFWKDCVAVERFKYPKTIEKIESNIQKLQQKVIQSDNADWYVPPSSHFVDERYTQGSLKEEPNFNDYDEFYTFGMSLGACVMMSPYGYCYLPMGKRYIIKDCCIQEDFGPNGAITNINEYNDYLKYHNLTFENAEKRHNEQLEIEINEYTKMGAARAHEKQYLEETDRYNFDKQSLYEPIKFRELNEVYSFI